MAKADKVGLGKAKLGKGRVLRKRLVGMYKFLLIGMAPALYFSYFPVIRLASDATMNYELSVAVIWLVMLDVVGIVTVVSRSGVMEVVRGWLGRKWMWLLFPLWVTASVIWSANVTRGVLTAGMMWAVIVAVMVIWELRGVCDEGFRRCWWKVFTVATLLVCGWCVVQCVLDLCGVSREVTGMCAGCVTEMFGFPHPNGFAIEPQFMGNLLLAPAVMLAATVISHQGISSSSGLEFFSTSYIGQPRKLASGGGNFLGAVRNIRVKNSDHVMMTRETLGWLITMIVFIVTVATIFLTFSRGAIYALVLGVGVMGVYYIVKRGVWKRVVLMWGMVVMAFVLMLNLQGLMAELSPTNDSYVTGVARVINHLSLGIIDVRGENGEVSDSPSPSQVEEYGEVFEVEGLEAEVTEPMVDADGLWVDGGGVVTDAAETGKVEAVFDGYVEESTETRMRLTRAAFAVWRQDLPTMFMGVGIGGAGVALYEAGLSPAPKEIVQNEYASLLLETGAVGVVLFVVLVVVVVVVLVRRRAAVVIVLLIVYGATLMFFSGLPNALHIYLMPVLLLAYYDTYNGRRKKLVS